MSDANPAIVPEPVGASPGRYTVTGSQPVLGHRPGETFTATLPQDREARLLASGAIALAVDELDRLTRDDLNLLAAEHGVSDPEQYPNKQAVIDAIRVATNSTQEG